MLKRINYTEDAATGLGTMPPLVPYEKHARFQFTVNQDTGRRTQGRRQAPPSVMTSGIRGRSRWLWLRSPDFVARSGLPLLGVLDDGC
jgi:hypothetical protein